MALHNWMRIDEGIFHDFYLSWNAELIRTFNIVLLPKDYYALIEPSSHTVDVDHEVKSTYAALARRITIRRSTDHKEMAIIEIVSPCIKTNQRAFENFVHRAVNLIRQGIHLLVIDILPPSSGKQCETHQAIWAEVANLDHVLSGKKTGVLSSYQAGVVPNVFIEAIAVGDSLAGRPVFRNEDQYMPVPLEETYQKAWETVPEYWREVITKA